MTLSPGKPQAASPPTLADATPPAQPHRVPAHRPLADPLPEQLKHVFGYGQHKRNMAREAAAATVSGKGAAKRRVHDGAGAIMPSSDRVACVTMLAPHTCQKSLVLPPDLPDLVPSSADHKSAQIGDECDGEDASDHLSEAISLTSAAGLKRRTNQGPTFKDLH